MIAVIKIRSEIGTKQEIKDTFQFLNLKKKNSCVLLKETPPNIGMVKKVKDYVTWGEINKETLLKLISKRARLPGDKRADFDEKKLKEIAEQLLKAARLADFGLKPCLRLNPPRKGFERGGIKKAFKAGGVLGYRGEKINDLLNKMI